MNPDPSERGSSSLVGSGPIGREEFRRLAEIVLKLSPGQRTFFVLHDGDSGTTRFANNQIVQNVHTRRVSLAVTVAFGQQHGTATATDFGEETLRDVVQRAAQIARLSPPDPEYMPPLQPQDYPPLSTVREDTVGAGPTRRIALAREAIELCKSEHLTAAGIVSSSFKVVGLAANTGLFAYEPRTESKFSVTAMGAAGSRASGWAANVHRSIEQLQVVERTRTAIEKAKRSVELREIPAGRYTVILEPAAVAGLIGPLVWMLDAKSYYKGTSPFVGKVGRAIIDRRLTLQNRPEHEDLLGDGFNGEGLPASEMTWIEHGVLRQLRYDRYTAQEHHVYPTPALDAPYLSAESPSHEPASAPGSSVSTLDELIAGTERGILVTNFWYIRTVNPTDLTLTGMTRDGTFLIEDGRVGSALVDFRWHESPLRALLQVDGLTAPADAVSNENWKMKLPALKLRDFNFSSVSRL
ncbi:MAG TPA: TldD/PmbA family protein [Nitrospiraceae bacterium]|nr:TldD/PmbA family protein [Nitrospiraceae bacterium]